MIRIFLILTIVGSHLTLFSQFRQTTWAMGKEKIKEVETAEFIEETPNTLQYKTTVGDWNATCTYFFENGTFYQAEYLLDIQHKNKNAYIDEYFRIKEILQNKYGQAHLEEDYVWKDDKHKDNQFFHGHAVSLGHLELRNLFDGKNIHIKPLLKGKDSNIHLIIRYINPYYKKKKTEEGF